MQKRHATPPVRSLTGRVANSKRVASLVRARRFPPLNDNLTRTVSERDRNAYSHSRLKSAEWRLATGWVGTLQAGWPAGKPTRILIWDGRSTARDMEATDHPASPDSSRLRQGHFSPLVDDHRLKCPDAWHREGCRGSLSLKTSSYITSVYRVDRYSRRS